MPCIYGLYFANNFKFGTQSTRFVKSCMSVQQLLNSLHAMISALMNPSTATDTKKIDAYIKFYLSCGHQASKLIDGKGELFWMDRGNQLSLLNLPAQISRFGPVRWYWEGVSEAFIQEVKPYLIVSMRKSGTYFRDKLTLMYKLRAMKFIKQQMNTSTQEDDLEKESRSKGFYRYESLADIEKSFQSGMPISAFIFQRDFIPQDRCLVWVAFGRGPNTNVVPIQYCPSTNSVELCGVTFLDSTLLSKNILPGDFNSMRSKISSYCVLLPYITNHANRVKPNFNRKYAYVFDDWNILRSGGTKNEVLLSPKLFLLNTNI